MGPFRLSQDSIPADFLESHVSDEDMDNTVVQDSTSSQGLIPKKKST